MAVRWSDARLLSSAITRALVVKAFEGFRCDEENEDRHVRAQADRLEHLRSQVTASLAGVPTIEDQDKKTEEQCEPEEKRARQSKTTDTPSADGQTEEDSEQCSGDSVDTDTAAGTASCTPDPAGPMDSLVRWVTPKHATGQMHAAAEHLDEHQMSVAWCRRASNRAFVHVTLPIWG